MVYLSAVGECVGYGECDATVMDGVRIPMERTAALLKWDMVGEVLVPGVFVEGDIDKTDGCAQAADWQKNSDKEAKKRSREVRSRDFAFVRDVMSIVGFPGAYNEPFVIGAIILPG